MKTILISSVVVLLLFLSCDKKEENKNPGTIEFILNTPESTLKSTDSVDSSKIAYAIVTIKDKNGAVVYNNEELPVYRMGNTFITKPLSLVPGEYTLTSFLISDNQKIITFATPLTGSNLGYLVKYALPYKFNVGGDQVLKVAPEIISTANINASEFGYSTFSLNVVETFNINISAFIYNSVIENYELTDATLKIKILYPSDTISDTVHLAKKTNQIVLPDKPVTFILTASKSGYNSITYTYSDTAVKEFQTKPLMFIFDQTSTLVAHYPLDGNVLDYSGFNNHGTLFGAVTEKDRRDSTNKAYRFDGTDDYIRIPNSTSLNPTEEITVAAWYKTTPFVGSGNDGLVNKAYSSHISPYYQYHLGVAGDGYWNGYSGFGFSLGLDDVYEGVGTGSGFYQLNKWYHIVGTYNGSEIKLYVNGTLVTTKAANGKMKDYGSDLFISRQGNYSEYYNTTFHLPGTVDDVKIYNVALTASQILSLYQQ